MIDFRYHLVSLVSVFMALAIGVVLGAGPLRDSIGDQLSTQVDALAQDKSDLQQAVSNRESEIADRDAFVDAVGGALTASQLGGRSVVLVTLPGADSGQVDALSETLASAGATVTGQVALNQVWTDPGQADARAAALDDLAPLAAAGSDGSGDATADPGATGEPTDEPTDEATTDPAADATLASLLADAVLTPELSQQGVPGDSSQALLDGLGGADLVGTDGDPAARATLAVVVTGSPADSVGADDDAWAEAATTEYLALLQALDAGSAGVLLAGPQSAAADDGLLGQLRSDEATAAEVSGVDTADTPMGRVTTVLGLREEMAGRSGQYGYADNASAPVPADLTAPSGSTPSDESTPSGTGTDG